jgi:hypothetical protein
MLVPESATDGSGAGMIIRIGGSMRRSRIMIMEKGVVIYLGTIPSAAMLQGGVGGGCNGGGLADGGSGSGFPVDRAQWRE